MSTDDSSVGVAGTEPALADTQRELADIEVALPFVSEERDELRDVLNEWLASAHALDDTVYPDCNPVHAEDRSLFGLPTGADMADVIALVTERCGPPDPFIAKFDSWDFTPDRDQWGPMCTVDDVSTHRTWRFGERVLTVHFYRGGDGLEFTDDTGWMFGWTGGDLPGGIEIGMTQDEVTTILGLDPGQFEHDEYLADHGVDYVYYWGQGTGGGYIAEGHGQPYNSSILYFNEGLLTEFGATAFNLCQ